MNITTFDEAVSYINSFIPAAGEVKFSGQFGLDRQQHLLHLLGDPQNQYPCVHITGTSGKSSTSYLIAKILQESGYRVGLHISPHLVSMRERIQIAGEPVSEREFVSLLNAVIPHVLAMRESIYEKPTYFEILVAMTFLAFSLHHIDIAVVEVGLGGRYDGTNVVTKTQVAVITNIGLDHTQILGDTVEKIIDDKKEIIKPGSTVVSGATQPTVRERIKKKCVEVGATLSFLDEDALLTNILESSSGTIFDISYKSLRMQKVTVGLLGAHQARNAAVAIMATYELSQKGFTVTDSKIRHALQKTIFAGRLQIMKRQPLVVLDGAHNEDKIRALVHTFPHCFSYRTCIVILALKKDKDAESILPIIMELADKIVVTTFTKETDIGTSLSADVDALANRIQSLDPKKQCVVDTDSVHAVNEALQKQQPDEAILVTGSLYLVGEILKAIAERQILL